MKANSGSDPKGVFVEFIKRDTC